MDSKTFLSKIQITPPPIRAWFASEEVSLMVRTINQHFNIQKADETIIPKLLARLEVKDIEPDYFAGELSEELKLDRDKALGISGEIKRTILGSLNKEFSGFGINISLLDKFQIPAIKGLSPSTISVVVGAPKIIQDVSTAVPLPAQKPVTFSDVGWSKMPTTAAPAPVGQSSAPVVAPTLPRPTTIPAPTPVAQAKPAELAPMMLHEDTTFKPAEKNEGFTLSKPSATAEMHMGVGMSQAPARPAVLEFGGMKIPVPKPPTPATGGAYHGGFGIGSRNVSQIMPAIPVPIPKPPTPITMPSALMSASSVPLPQPPKPPAPPSQISKPIVKDFL